MKRALLLMQWARLASQRREPAFAQERSWQLELEQQVPMARRLGVEALVWRVVREQALRLVQARVLLQVQVVALALRPEMQGRSAR